MCLRGIIATSSSEIGGVSCFPSSLIVSLLGGLCVLAGGWGLASHTGGCMDSYTAQVVVVVVLRPTVSPSPGELNFVPHIWVKVTEDSKRKNGEWKGWWVVGGCRGLIHARFPTLTVVGGGLPFCVCQ